MAYSCLGSAKLINKYIFLAFRVKIENSMFDVAGNIAFKLNKSIQKDDVERGECLVHHNSHVSVSSSNSWILGLWKQGKNTIFDCTTSVLPP
jgi:hypothetical protein